MGASDDKILERAIIAVTRLQSKARGLQAVRRSAQLKRNSDARRLMELMGVPALAPTRSTQAEVPPTPLDSPRVAVPTPDARPPVQPATYVMPPLPPGPPPLPPGPPPQPSQLVQPPLPLSAPPHYSMPAVPPPVPPPMPPPVPAASQSMHSAAMLSVPAATPQKLDFTGLGQPGSCSMNSPACATELQSPQTHWTTRQQSRLHPADMTAPNGMSLSPLQRMSAAVMHTVELSPQERLLTAVVMQRFCRWGEHRTIGDWPAELRAYGPLPAIHDALRASRTRSLTLPQLVTAIKERTGGCAGGKALDMLNLKAYVRCFPALFHLRSGRTAAGRPLDVVELRIEFNDGMMANQQRQRYGVSGLSAVPPPPPPPPLPGLPVTHSMQGVGQQTSGQISGNGGQWTQLSARSALPQVNSNTSSQIGCPVERTASAPPAAPGCLDYNQVQAPSPSPTPSNSSSTLQPKELFASEGEGGSPRSLWSSPSLPNSFSLFGTAFSNNGSGVSSPAASPQAVLVPGEKSSFPAGATALVDTNSFADSMPNYDAEDSQSAADAETDEPLMLAQIDALFSGAGKDEEVTTAPAGLGEPGPAARAAYVKRFQLDRIFAAAVDRAMRHQVASPVEFIAHELLRHGEQQALPNTA